MPVAVSLALPSQLTLQRLHILLEVGQQARGSLEASVAREPQLLFERDEVLLDERRALQDRRHRCANLVRRQVNKELLLVLALLRLDAAALRLLQTLDLVGDVRHTHQQTRHAWAHDVKADEYRRHCPARLPFPLESRRRQPPKENLGPRVLDTIPRLVVAELEPLLRILLGHHAGRVAERLVGIEDLAVGVGSQDARGAVVRQD